jgi:hypothetical protein
MGTKLVMILDQGGNSWTESHVLDGTPTDFSAEDAKAQTLIPKRLACCGKQTSLTFYKLIDTVNPRRFLLGEWYPSITGSGSHDSDAPDTAVLIRAHSAAFEYTRFYMRGVWDDAIQLGGQILPSWWGIGAPFDLYRNQVLADHWGWTGRDRTLKKRAQPIGITQNVDWTVAIVMPAAFFPAPIIGTTQQVRFAGLLGALSLNGQQIIQVDDATHAHTLRRIPIVPWVNATGFLTLNTAVFKQFSQLQAERVVERKVGRPLYHSAGRRKARKLG